MTAHHLADPVHETAEPGTPMHRLAPDGWYAVECATCGYYARDVIQACAQERADAHVQVAS